MRASGDPGVWVGWRNCDGTRGFSGRRCGLADLRNHLLFAPGRIAAPRELKALQFVLRSGVGSLHAALRLPETVEEADARVRDDGFLAEIRLACFHAIEFPLRDRHLLQIELLTPRLRLPFDLQVAAKLVKFIEVLAGQDDASGAKAVMKGVHADGRFSFGRFGASRL